LLNLNRDQIFGKKTGHLQSIAVLIARPCEHMALRFCANS